MFYRATGPAPLDPALLAREIERRAGLSSSGPQVRTLPQVPDDALVAGGERLVGTGGGLPPDFYYDGSRDG